VRPLPIVSTPANTLESALPGGAIAVRGLYAHVPFCFHKCHYCDFYSLVDREDRQPAFTARFEHDAWVLRERLAAPLATVFVGGGTPTLLAPPLLARTLAAIAVLPREPGCEWTVEANPETVTDEVAGILVAAGVNRVSLGAQSFDPRHLATLERHHDPASVARAVGRLRAAGIANLNLDLIFGIPGQTVAEAIDDVERALSLGPDHLSCYGLTYEPATALHARRERGLVTPIDEEVEAEMYEAITARLAAAGFAPYEISNWSRPGRECRHNLVYWRNEPWWAIGPSGSGFVAGHRFKIVPRLGDWLAAPPGATPIVDHEPPDRARFLAESLLLGLRLVEGIPESLVAEATAERAGREAVFERAVAAGLLVREDGRLRFTAAGRLVADSVLSELV
jgi:oxygen-independent coproporphyrinogen-3 oxidase